jgi:hypothetical protein
MDLKMNNELENKWREEFSNLSRIQDCVDTYAGVNRISHYDIAWEFFLEAKRASQVEIEKRDQLIREAMPWVYEIVNQEILISNFPLKEGLMNDWLQRAKALELK